MIKRVEGLDKMKKLATLNLSHNQIQKIENLHCCPKLSDVNFSNNFLESLDSVRHLTLCKNISVLDLSNNKISDEGIIDILKQMPNLGVLYLKGNPVVGKIQSYRKVMISSLPNLNYLDDRPVFEEERLCAIAWSKGGIHAEMEERRRIKEEKEEKRRRLLSPQTNEPFSFNFFLTSLQKLEKQKF
jgi:dynein assembly factor 1